MTILLDNGGVQVKKEPNYYKGKVCLNVLAQSVENAKKSYKAASGHVVLGVLSKNYHSDEAAIDDMKGYIKATNNALSIGLGAGDPRQSQMVARLAKELQPQHVNQVFTGVGTSRALLGQNETVINGLVSPSGKVGLVNIATGPLSSESSPSLVPIESAIALLKDMGGSSIKYFPMNGLKHIEEYKAVAEACAQYDFILEPTGGIDLDNFEYILSVALEAGVKKVIPHVYSSIINKETGTTDSTMVEKLFEITKSVVG